MKEIAYAIRGLRKRPLFAATTVLILGLGIGSTTAVFSVVNGVLLTPLPFPAPERLVAVWKHNVERGFTHDPLVYPEIVRWRDTSTSFTSAAGMSWHGAGTHTLTLDGTEHHPSTLLVTHEFFDVLEVPALHGRTFLPEDDAGGDAPALVLSHGFWRRAFEGDPGVIGRRVEMRVDLQESFRIVGVLPPGMEFPPDTDAYAVAVSINFGWRDSRTLELDLIGRLAPGVTVDEARAEQTAVSRRMTAEDPTRYPRVDAVVTPLLETLTGSFSRALWLLLAAVGVVLAIASANVANLLLVRGASRERELSVRIAMGAGRGRIARQLLAEAFVIAVAGAALGSLTAHWGLRALLLLRPEALPRADQASVDLTVLAFAAAVTLIATLGAALVPMWRALGQDALSALRGGRGGPSPARAMRAVAVLEIALALMLVVGAGLLIRAFDARVSADRGFASEQLVMAGLQVPADKYQHLTLLAFADRVVERVNALPGVSSSVVVHMGPARGSMAGIIGPPRIEGQTEEEIKQNPMANLEFIQEDYFRTLGIPLISGRTFTISDRGNDNRVAIVSRSFEEKFFAGDTAVGKRLGDGSERSPFATIIGVTGNVRYRELNPWFEVYYPAGQSFATGGRGFFFGQKIMIRSTRDPSDLAPSLRAALAELDAEASIASVESVGSALETELARPRFQAVILGVFAAAALLLAAIGIYGVVATLASSRAPEIGLRMALGSSPARAVATIWSAGAWMSVSGVVLGVFGAFATTRYLDSLLFEVSPLDPASFTGAAAFLTIVALLAAYVPARRAARVDPAITLRHE